MAGTVDFSVHGVDQFLAVSKALKRAGETGLRKELHAGMRKAAKPLVPAAKKAAAEVFPKRGGLAKREGKVAFRAQLSTGAIPGVRIVAPGRFVVAKTVNLNGTFRHPVYADPTETRKDWQWVSQRIPGAQGWFDDSMMRNAPAIRKDLEQALNNMINKIAKGAS